MTITFPPGGEQPTDDAYAAIERLARLDALAYEITRKSEAEHLQIRATVLDRHVQDKRRELGLDAVEIDGVGLKTVDPWPIEVSGEVVADAIVNIIAQYVVSPAWTTEAMALWVFAAHAFKCFQHSPRLAIMSPEKGCGKSTALDCVGSLCNRPLMAASLTAPLLYRVIEAEQPTMLVDEIDAFLPNSEELRGIINAGHRQGTPAWRLEGEAMTPKAFKTFAPMAMAGIGIDALPDTIRDRSIIVPLRRAKPGEVPQRLRLDRTKAFDDLASMVARWVDDNRQTLRRHDPDVPAQLQNRQADNWRPLIAIADIIGGKWSSIARQSAIALSAEKGDASPAVALLEDFQAFFAERGAVWVSSLDVVEHLATLEDRPWPEYKQGRAISAIQVSRLLHGFNIWPQKKKQPNKSVIRGYAKNQFSDAWDRYLAPQDASTRYPATNGGNPGLSEGFNPLPDNDEVAGQNGEKWRFSADGGGVAGRKGVEPDAFDLDTFATGTRS